MVSPNENQTSAISENTTVVVDDKKPSTTEQSTSGKAPHISSQKQLLGLARKFSLDGGLLPENKQAPIEDRSFRRIKLAELRQQQNIEAIILTD